MLQVALHVANVVPLVKRIRLNLKSLGLKNGTASCALDIISPVGHLL